MTTKEECLAKSKEALHESMYPDKYDENGKLIPWYIMRDREEYIRSKLIEAYQWHLLYTMELDKEKKESSHIAYFSFIT